MKVFIFILLCYIPLPCLAQKKPPAKIKARLMRSDKKEIDFKVGTTDKQIWTISLEVKPDKLQVECGKSGTILKFISDRDSITFLVKEGDVICFNILLNNKDTAQTEVSGIPQNVKFSNAYIAAHRHKIEVEIPEVHELVNIALALTDVGLKDSNMVAMNTAYYQEVVKKFGQFKKHPLIVAMNAQLNNPDQNESYWWYYSWKMNACAFEFRNGKIVNNGIIRNMGFNHPENPIPSHTLLLQSFAAQTGFRQFYKAHILYYDTLNKLYRSLNPIDRMQGWLEKTFHRQYGNYSVYFSPLVGGAHATQRYADNGFSQTAMFVCAARMETSTNRSVNEMLESRIVFTEIDHNFVNPVTDNHLAEVKRVFGNRAKWVDDAKKGTGGYTNEESVFNEYMTWAVYSLYCIDNFKETDYEVMLKNMESQMEQSRGFIRFKGFNRQLIKLYKDDKKVTVDELYKNIIVWCGQM